MLDGNQGIANGDYLNYNMWQKGKPKRENNTKRSLQITCEVNPSEENKFEQYFMQDATIPDVKFVQRSGAPGTYGEYDALTEWVFKTCEIKSFPSLGGESQTLVLGAYNNEGAAEFTIESSQPSYEDKLFNYGTV